MIQISNSDNKYIESNNIRVFPCAYRGYFGRQTGTDAYGEPIYDTLVFDPEARATTEANFTNTFHRLSSNKDSYIVAWVPNSTDGTGTLKCVIGGYYFEIYNHTMEDFFYNATDSYYLCIKTAPVELGTSTDEDGTRETKVLVPFGDEIENYLDIIPEDQTIHVFTGLVLSTTKAAGSTASIRPFITGSTFIEVDIASNVDNDHKAAQVNKYYFNEDTGRMTLIESTSSLAPNGSILYIKHNSYRVDPANLPVTSLLDVGGGKYSLRMVEDTTEQGINTTIASGDYSVALGRQTVASGLESTALGAESIASGEGSLAAGLGTQAKAKGAFAVGNNTIAGTDEDNVGVGAFAVGNNTKAEASGAVAMGTSTQALGENSLAAGNATSTTETAINSVALGDHTTANQENQVVIGKYNQTDAEQAFIIANGNSSGDTTANKFTVDYDGDVKALGTLEVVGGSIKATNESTNTLELGTDTAGSSGAIKVYGTGTSEVFKVTNNGDTDITGAVSITKNTDSSSATSGALKVAGGVGISKKLNVSGDTSIKSETNSTTVDSGALTVTGGAGIGKNLNVGANLEVNENTNLNGTLIVANSKQTTLTGNTEIQGVTTISNTTNSESKTTGALVVKGGVGIEKDLYVNGKITSADGIRFTGDNVDITGLTKISNETPSDASTNGALTVAGGVGIQGALNTGSNVTIGGTATVTNAVTINGTDDSDSTATGALTIAGGVGIAKNLNVGGNLTLDKSGAQLTVGGGATGGYLYVNGSSGASVFSVQNSGATSISGKASITDATAASESNGALKVTGGVYAGKGLYVAANGATIKGNAAITGNTSITGATTITGDTTITGNVTVTAGKKITVPTIEGLTSLGVSGAITATDQITGKSFNATSDNRLKQNIEDYKFTGNILDLPIKQFEYINDESHTKYIGCIAQDLQTICPELVVENEEGFLAIQESKLIYALIQEVKELKEKVNLLEGR